TSLLSFASLMLFVAPASATSGLAIVSGLGSFLVALESVVARGRMMALNKEIADLTSRVHQLERAEQRRLTLEIKESGHPRHYARPAAFVRSNMIGRVVVQVGPKTRGNRASTRARTQPCRTTARLA